MSLRLRAAVLGPLLALLAGCPQNNTTPDPVKIDVAVSATEVTADGTKSVEVTVDYKSDVKLTASRGKFKDQKGNSVTITGGSGTVTLVTCDSRSVAGCAGTVRINASSVDGTGAGSASVTFLPLENCANGVDDNADGKTDCEDPACLNYTCALPAGSVGDGKCMANGTCLCSGNGGTGEPNESSCMDGKDNDCDGLIDCKDSSCDGKTCIMASGGQGICVGLDCGCPGTTEEDPDSCSDKIDNDCDGRVDCDDKGCQAKLGELGVVCDALGHTCSRGSADGGTGSCSVCPGGETAEVTCNDQKDNDCDGLSDCEDPDCAQKTCGENGRLCNGTTQHCECSGNGGPFEALERTCGDMADNDCDGKADCDDEDCKGNGNIPGRACAAHGFFCSSEGKCTCSGNGGVPEATEATCFDGADNDCDGIQDCEETVCQPVGNGIGQICNMEGHVASGLGELTCSSTITGASSCNVCTVPGGVAETAEGVSTTAGGVPTCGDGKDNDCDGPIDCADTNCTGMPCDQTGKKCAANGQCTCTPSPAGPEQVCTDGVDNDCDGKVDCADTTCDNRACVLANGAPGRCKAGACGCPGIDENTDAACSDGIDDDCDGLADCADPDCQGSLSAAGKGCDSNGHVCGKPDAAGMATCSICSRDEPGGETKCSDGVDNDCDGLKDCADPDCGGHTCGNHGVACNASTKACECTGNGGAPQFAESSCTDGFDNDCDGNPDCRDSNCQPSATDAGAVCQLFGPGKDQDYGFRCDTNGGCNCAGNGGVAQPGDAGESFCDDGIDNDCNGIKDCQETYCQAVGNQPGKICDSLHHAASGVGEITCSVATLTGGSTCSICTLPDGKVSEYGGHEGQSTVSNGTPTCGDGVDNDCNGPIDCADPACTGQPCDPTGTRKCTASGTCSCQKTETAESTCSDGADNDCDGKIDCEDSDCMLLKCVYAKDPRNPNNYVYGQCAYGVGCTFSGEPEDGGATCSDGIDNNGNFLTDCADPSCQSVRFITQDGGYLAYPGQICNTVRGLRCGIGDPDAGGVATCSVCLINDPLADGGISPETSCFDTLDNDCNGLVDCADTSCKPASGTGPGRACRPDGGWACGATGSCDCFMPDGGPGQTKETSCGDGVDNDCDTLVDCMDPDCRPSLGSLMGQSCAANGKTCDSAGLCSCTPPDGGFEPAEVTCSDGIDNDCDGIKDCEETACQPVGNNPGQVCDRLGHALGTSLGEWTCSPPAAGGGSSACHVICTLPPDKTTGAPRFSEVTEGATTAPGSATCGDGLDNDCNGYIDCLDSNCLGKTCDSNGRTCDNRGQCAACSGGETQETTCNDGKDNDCDGLIDCQDPNCQPSGSSPGLTCGANGMQCGKPTNGANSTCTCSGNGGQAQPVETSCGDGFDNDCDGYTDCADTNCRSTDALTPDGGSCDDPNAVPAMIGFKCDSLGGCVCPGGQTAESTCYDGKDNDCDGKIDCADPDCQPSGGNLGKACNANGMRCTAPAPGAASGTCTDCRPPSLDGGAGEVAEATCYDGVDNDCDGVVDCSDPNCQPQPPSTTGASCKGPTSSQKCVLGGAGGSSGTGGGTGPATTQGICLDPAIGGNITLTANPTKLASDGIATGTIYATAKYGPDVSQPSTLVPLASVTCSRTDANNVTYTNQGIVFTLTSAAGTGTLIDPTDATRTSTTSLCMPTDASGIASVTLKSNSTGTTATVKATYTDDIGLYSGKKLSMSSDPLDVAEPKLGTIVVAPDPNYQKLMGVKSSGYRESQTVSFYVRDTDTNTYPAGLTVTFTHESKGGSFLGETANCSGTPRICTATAKTDATGKATVTLNSGTLASIVYVKASATAGGISGNVSVTDIAIVGAKTSGANVSLSCEFRTDPKDSKTITGTPPEMFGALQYPDYFDCSKTFYRMPDTQKFLHDFGYTCAAFFGDRFNNVIAIPTVTTLAAEAGNAAPPGSSAPSATATAPAVDGWIVNGQAINVVAVTGYATPADVAPIAALYPSEPSSTNLDDEPSPGVPGCGTRTRNPRDELSTTILTVAGEEGFIDGSNGCPADGTYNGKLPDGGIVGPLADGGFACDGGVGESFIDIGEPFVDVNDNNVRDNGEYFIDTNSNQVWDGPNDIWDSSTTLWVAKRVRYSAALPYGGSAGTGARPKVYEKSDGTSPAACPTCAAPANGYNYIIMSSDTDTSGAADNPALTSNNSTSGTFYAAFFDVNAAPVTPLAMFSPSDKNPSGGTKPTMSWGTASIDKTKVPEVGFTESVVYCPSKPSASTPISLASCASTCTAVNASNGACYQASKLGLYPLGREVSVSFTANGSGVTYLGMAATTQLPVGLNPDNSAKMQTYQGTTENAAQVLSVCVRETPGALCGKSPSYACGARTMTDACGLTRTLNCGSCSGSMSCCPNSSSGRGCVDTQTDSANCGGCGIVCGGATPTCCGGTCVNTSTNNSNCGACGTKCTGIQVCTNSACG